TIEPAGLHKNGSSFVSFSLSPFLSFIQKEITETQPNHRRKEWHTAAVGRTQSSPSVRLSSFPRAPSLQPLFAVTDRSCFLELGVRRLCLLSRASAAVCLPFTFASSFSRHLRSRSSPFTFSRRSPFAIARSSPFEFAFAFVWKPRCSASNSATNPRAPPSRRTALFCSRRDDFYAANGLRDWATIFPKTSVLIPIRDVPIKIFDVQDSPSSPPGFLPTTPVVEAGETTQGSDLYIAGPLVGFGLLIALLASGLYVKNLKKWKNDAVVPSSDSNSTNLICSTTGSSPMYMETSRRCSTASWLTPDLLAEIKYCLVNYTIEEIEKATKNFSEENKIGDLAYKGLLNNLEEVMVKRMRFEDTGQVIDLHSKINHFNIVELLGVCYGSESKVSSSPSWSYLVFELPKNGCLRECLSDPCNNLNWYKRIQIAFDIATCLYYLHCCAFPSYAHMNVNSRNIFITSKWRGKLADVGRALAIKSTPQKRNNDSIELVKGWVAPEYLLNRTVSEKVDIFAFGVVLLELISGRDNFDEKTAKDSLGFLLGEASEGGCFEGLRSFMDPNLKDYDLPEALCLSFLAKDCVADDPMYRPTMDDIMKVLSKMV
ncbi:protein LYK5, partial [Arachis ipaensis]|uniref:protein LYK5 n=1 Tax=Arachis ipaensis TaxID=130454 RepID=UPI000A2B2FA3